MTIPAGTAISDMRTEREAKEYLVQRILAEGQNEGLLLSDLERAMLYFSETGWTLPNMLEIAAKFERACDDEEYEQKIARIIREIERQNEVVGGDQQAKWDDAVVKLSDGDHYLLVLIGIGRSSPHGRFSKWLPSLNFYGTGEVRPAGDFFRLILMALIVILVMFLVAALKSWVTSKLGSG